MSSVNLTPTSYLVLGLVAGLGSATPYEMKQMVAASLGYFWSFPHSQLYAESDRLVEAGLLEVDQEEGGRRRKRYSVTADGKRALEAWLSDPAAEGAETRDPGLLKLFFGGLTDPAHVEALALAQIEHHRQHLALYEAIEAAIKDSPDLRFPYLTLRLGITTTRANLEFWEELAANPPR